MVALPTVAPPKGHVHLRTFRGHTVQLRFDVSGTSDSVHDAQRARIPHSLGMSLASGPGMVEVQFSALPLDSANDPTSTPQVYAGSSGFMDQGADRASRARSLKIRGREVQRFACRSPD